MLNQRSYNNGCKGRPETFAADTGLSTGAVTSIINEWRRGLSYPLVDELREQGLKP